MTVHVVQHETPDHRSFRLTRPAPRQTSQVQPDVVMTADRARALLAAAARRDVSAGGSLSAGPAGIQVWSGPWDAPDGRAGSAVHLGSVDWSWETPAHHVTVYRVLVTAAGAAAGLTPAGLLERVLRLDGQTTSVSLSEAAVPLPRDPFKAEAWNALTGTRL